MTTERIIRAEKMGWALTDDDCFQWQRGVIKQERPFAKCAKLQKSEMSTAFVMAL